jgi:hypothetical protein
MYIYIYIYISLQQVYVNTYITLYIITNYGCSASFDEIKERYLQLFHPLINHLYLTVIITYTDLIVIIASVILIINQGREATFDEAEERY